MSTWINRGASGGLAGGLKIIMRSIQQTASHMETRIIPHGIVRGLKCLN